MPSVILAGGGLAGLASAAALGSLGWGVDLFEARPFLGGRAASYELPDGAGERTVIDNCQHILLKCCVNLIDFYRRLGVEDRIEWHKRFYFFEPGGRVSIFEAGVLPRPLHFTESLLRASWLSWGEKVALGRALVALRWEWMRRRDLSQITMIEWLREKRQPPRLVDRFWRQILVSAINEDLERMAAVHGFQVLRLAFLAARDSYEMGIPAVALSDLYAEDCWRRLPSVRIHTRKKVDAVRPGGVWIGGVAYQADAYIDARPQHSFPTSPITGIHLWFDRPVTSLPHGTLLDRTIQWFFNKDRGRYLQLVVSASRTLLEMPRSEVIALARRELAEFLPEVKTAVLLKAHVVKETRATFSATPEVEQQRPDCHTEFPNVFRAGDWTRSGWPATMEGAVRSGYRAAEAASGQPFLLPDID